MTHTFPKRPTRTRHPGAVAPTPALALSIALVGVSWLFHAFPGIDIRVSGWFHDPVNGFALQDDAALTLLRWSGIRITQALLLILVLRLGWLGWQVLRGGAAAAWARARGALWLLACLATGPGLLVNGLLKSHWGRPRPRDTDLFGGAAPFEPVWVIGDGCARNCSFVSGEAASAAWLVAAALLAPRPIRPAVVAVTSVYALALSLNRVAFGGHYLSDVVLAWLLCGLVFLALHRLIVADRES